MITEQVISSAQESTILQSRGYRGCFTAEDSGSVHSRQLARLLPCRPHAAEPSYGHGAAFNADHQNPSTTAAMVPGAKPSSLLLICINIGSPRRLLRTSKSLITVRTPRFGCWTLEYGVNIETLSSYFQLGFISALLTVKSKIGLALCNDPIERWCQANLHTSRNSCRC